MTKDETARLVALEVETKIQKEFREKTAPGFWWVIHMREIAIGLVSALAAIAFGGWSFMQRLQHVETVSKRSVDDIEKLSQNLDKLSQNLKSTEDRYNRLREHVVVLFERQPKGAPQVPQGIVYHGRILRILKDGIVLLPGSDQFEAAIQFPFAPKTVVTIDRMPATLDVLRAGMIVGVIQLEEALIVELTSAENPEASRELAPPKAK